MGKNFNKTNVFMNIFDLLNNIIVNKLFQIFHFIHGKKIIKTNCIKNNNNLKKN